MTKGTQEDILKPLTEAEVEELLLLYKCKYGINNFHYLLLYNQCKWNKQLREIGDKTENNVNGIGDQWIAFRKNFYTHRKGDFRQYGTYVSLHEDTMQSVSFNSWQPELKELYECLSETQLIEWSKGPLLTNVDLQYSAPLQAIIESKGVSVQRARTCWGLVLNHEEALHVGESSLPAAYRMSCLQVADAERIHSLWVNKKEGSLTYLRGLIKMNQTLGIYRQSDGELVAWIFQNDFSGLGILQVQPEIQRLGFGSILAACLSKQIAQVEQVPLSAWILIENFKSEALLQKLGFKKAVVNKWIQLNKKT